MEQDVLHDFEKKQSLISANLIIILLVVVILGGATGFLFSRNKKLNVSSIAGVAGGGASKGTTVGSTDTKTFKDTAEGILKEGGIEGEGQYHLVRPGGDSQNVYMTSSTIDLSSYLEKKVKVWGETQKAQKAGWLMDVGKLEVLE